MKTTMKLGWEHLDLFREATALEKLYLTGDTSQGIIRSHLVFGLIFQNITSLEVLYLQHVTWLQSLPPNSFGGLSSLRKLVVEFHGLQYVTQELFEGLNSLTYLSLQNNAIRVINQTSFPKDLLARIANLSLGANAFDCSCNLFWFTSWIAENKEKLVSYGNPKTHYMCQDQQYLVDVKMTPQMCLTNPVQIYTWMSVGVAALSVIITFVGSMFFRLRWHIRLWLFHLGTWLHPQRLASTSTRRYDFDLFVSHNADDTPWVYDVLLPELETRSNPEFECASTTGTG
jgi:hypothetical protein